MKEKREEIINYLKKHNPAFKEEKFEGYSEEMLKELKRITEFGAKAQDITDKSKEKQ